MTRSMRPNRTLATVGRPDLRAQASLTDLIHSSFPDG